MFFSAAHKGLQNHLKSCRSFAMAQVPVDSVNGSHESTSTQSISSSSGNLLSFADRLSQDDVHRAHAALAKWIYTDNQPFSVVENKSFREFISTVRPALLSALPTRYQIGGPLLDCHYNALRSSINTLIQQAEHLCTLSDGWSNVRGNSIINFVVTPDVLY